MFPYDEMKPVDEVSEAAPNLGEMAAKDSEPRIFRGLCCDWPIVKLAQVSDEDVCTYLKSIDRGIATTVLESNSLMKGRYTLGPDLHEFTFNSRSRTLTSALDQILTLRSHPNPPGLYIQSTELNLHGPGFAALNPCPWVPGTPDPRIWIGNQTHVQTHNDDDYNLAVTVAGQRRFVLFPPEALVNLYIGPRERTPSGRPISLVALDTIDFARFPQMTEALKVARIAILEPGDALFIPRYWWHQVSGLARFNILINYWWGQHRRKTENPHVAFICALTSIKALPPHERAYWKTMMEHYVFEVNGDPMSHMPVSLQGVLGAQSPAVRAELIQAFQQLMSS